jgi:hypothetical protein
LVDAGALKEGAGAAKKDGAEAAAAGVGTRSIDMKREPEV